MSKNLNNATRVLLADSHTSMQTFLPDGSLPLKQSFIKMHGNRVVRLIYPDRCIHCSKIIVDAGEIKICESCTHINKKINEPVCIKCGRRVDAPETECDTCKASESYYEYGRSLWEYDECTKKVIFNFKFNNKCVIGNTLAYLMQMDIMEKGIFDDTDIIIPVPLHSSKMKQRGYNQAEILADGIGRHMKLAVDKKALKRVKKTEPQMDLSRDERILNIKDSMHVKNNENIRGKNLLLIDDIFTTGTTLNECARVLKQGGARKVAFYTTTATSLQ